LKTLQLSNWGRYARRLYQPDCENKFLSLICSAVACGLAVAATTIFSPSACRVASFKHFPKACRFIRQVFLLVISYYSLFTQIVKFPFNNLHIIPYSQQKVNKNDVFALKMAKMSP
jgi:hypothetical protein